MRNNSVSAEKMKGMRLLKGEEKQTQNNSGLAAGAVNSGRRSSRGRGAFVNAPAGPAGCRAIPVSIYAGRGENTTR